MLVFFLEIEDDPPFLQNRKALQNTDDFFFFLLGKEEFAVEKKLIRLFVDGDFYSGEAFLGGQRLHDIRVDFDADAFQKREQGNDAAGLLEEHLAVLVVFIANRLVDAIVNRELSQRVDGGQHLLLVLGERRPLFLGRVIEDDVILMWTKRSFLDEFGHENFLIDRSAYLFVFLPFGLIGVIRRSCGQGDDADVGAELFDEPFQGLLPFVLEVVSLIDADGFDAEPAHQIEKVYVRIVDDDTIFLHGQLVHDGMQGLIGDGVDQGNLMEVVGEIFVNVLPFFEEALREAVAPLVFDRRRRRQDDRWLVQSANEFQTKDGLTASRGGDDIDFPIQQVTVRIIENPLLIIAEGPMEKYLFERFHHANHYTFS